MLLSAGGDILAKYNDLRTHGLNLGSATSAVIADGIGGQVEHFQGGDIDWLGGVGAHEIHGDILAKYNDLRAHGVNLGHPTSDEAADGRGGRISRFQNGDIDWTPGFLGIGGTAHVIMSSGPIHDKIVSLQASHFDVGAPTSDVSGPLPGGGFGQDFQNASIFFQPGHPAFEVHGAIRDLWRSLGGVNSSLGFPTSDEGDAPGGGRVSHFEHGEIVSSSPVFPLLFWTGGAHVVSGGILDFYSSHALDLGPPQGDAFRCGNSSYQRFRNGDVTLPDGGVPRIIRNNLGDPCGDPTMPPPTPTPKPEGDPGKSHRWRGGGASRQAVHNLLDQCEYWHSHRGRS
jgi:hypothetical protein